MGGLSASPLVKIQGKNIKHVAFRDTSPTPVWPSPRVSATSSWPAPGAHLTKVLLPSEALHRPRKTLPIVAQKAVANNTSQQDPRWRTTIVRRDLLLNGQVLLILGTRFAGTIVPNGEEVPLAKIYDHVTPEELQRFETEEFIKEDKLEQDRLAAKQRGRPRKALGLGASQYLDPSLPSSLGSWFDIDGSKESTDRSGKRKRGRPSRHSVAAPSFNGPQPVSDVSTRETSVEQRPRGRPSKSSIAVPSFDGPKPVIDDSTRENSVDERAEAVAAAKSGVYSMVAASGIVPSTPSSTDLSRNITPLPVVDEEDADPTPKRRRLGDTDLDSPKTPAYRGTNGSRSRDPTAMNSRPHLNGNARSSSVQRLTSVRIDNSKFKAPVKRESPVEIDERVALIQQFQSKPPKSRNSPSLFISSSEPSTSLNPESPPPLKANHSATPRKARAQRLSITPHFPAAKSISSTSSYKGKSNSRISKSIPKRERPLDQPSQQLQRSLDSRLYMSIAASDINNRETLGSHPINVHDIAHDTTQDTARDTAHKSTRNKTPSIENQKADPTQRKNLTSRPTSDTYHHGSTGNLYVSRPISYAHPPLSVFKNDRSSRNRPTAAAVPRRPLQDVTRDANMSDDTNTTDFSSDGVSDEVYVVDIGRMRAGGTEVFVRRQSSNVSTPVKKPDRDDFIRRPSHSQSTIVTSPVNKATGSESFAGQRSLLSNDGSPNRMSKGSGFDHRPPISALSAHRTPVAASSSSRQTNTASVPVRPDDTTVVHLPSHFLPVPASRTRVALPERQVAGLQNSPTTLNRTHTSRPVAQSAPEERVEIVIEDSESERNGGHADDDDDDDGDDGDDDNSKSSEDTPSESSEVMVVSTR